MENFKLMKDFRNLARDNKYGNNIRFSVCFMECNKRNLQKVTVILRVYKDVIHVIPYDHGVINYDVIPYDDNKTLIENLINVKKEFLGWIERRGYVVKRDTFKIIYGIKKKVQPILDANV